MTINIRREFMSKHERIRLDEDHGAGMQTSDQRVPLASVATAGARPAATLSLQAVKYALTGVANSVIGIAVIFFALYQFGASDVAANAAGYAVGLSISFVLNRSWTFAHKGAISESLVKFLLIVGLAYLCNLAMVLVTHRVLGWNVYLAQLLGVAVYTFIGFFGSRNFAFANRS